MYIVKMEQTFNRIPSNIRRPLKGKIYDASIPAYMGTLVSANVNPDYENFKATKQSFKPGSRSMFNQIGAYPTNYAQPSCISITEKMARTRGANIGLTFNQSFAAMPPLQRDHVNEKVSIGNIGWNPNPKTNRLTTSV